MGTSEIRSHKMRRAVPYVTTRRVVSCNAHYVALLALEDEMHTLFYCNLRVVLILFPKKYSKYPSFRTLELIMQGAKGTAFTILAGVFTIQINAGPRHSYATIYVSHDNA